MKPSWRCDGVMVCYYCEWLLQGEGCGSKAYGASLPIRVFLHNTLKTPLNREYPAKSQDSQATTMMPSINPISATPPPNTITFSTFINPFTPHPPMNDYLLTPHIVIHRISLGITCTKVALPPPRIGASPLLITTSYLLSTTVSQSLWTLTPCPTLSYLPTL